MTRVALLLTLASLAFLAAEGWWVAELFSHYTAYYFLLAVVGMGWALTRQRRAAVALLAVCLLVNGARLAPLYQNDAHPGEGRGPPGPLSPAQAAAPVPVPGIHSAMTFNMNSYVETGAQTLAWLQAQAPDILVLIEVTQNDWDRFAPLRAVYPHSVFQPVTEPWGIGLMSRTPMTDAAVFHLPGSPIPSVRGRVELEGRELNVLGLHPPPPMGDIPFRMRNHDLRAAATWVRERDGPVLVLGDLNITRFSPHFQDMLEQGGLRDGALGFGWSPTWFLPPLALTIDHVLHTPDLIIHNREVGPDLGSDHRPVVVEFSFSPA